MVSYIMCANTKLRGAGGTEDKWVVHTHFITPIAISVQTLDTCVLHVSFATDTYAPHWQIVAIFQYIFLQMKTALLVATGEHHHMVKTRVRQCKYLAIFLNIIVDTHTIQHILLCSLLALDFLRFHGLLT